MDWRVSGGVAEELGGTVAVQMCLESQCICLCVSGPVIECVSVRGCVSLTECMSDCKYWQARLIEAGVVGKVVGLLQHDCKV